jgi:uncharacterized glyoxalase superfamily protein PhnB
MAVNYMPEGSRTVTPYLIIKGAAEALEFYKKAFGATEVARLPGPDGKSIMHAEMKIGDSLVLLADEAPQWGVVGPATLGGSGVTIHLYVPDVDSFVDQAVKAGAKVTMPITDMFWGDRFGKITDPFGHAWSVATHKEDVPWDEMARRGAEAMKEMCKQ